MKIDSISANNISFKSGYPTFGTGHLSLKSGYPTFCNDSRWNKLTDDPSFYTGIYYRPEPGEGILYTKLNVYA